MTTTQRVDVARLSELLDKATPGPWEVDPYGDVTANSEDVARIATGDDRAAYDAALIAAMHEALPALLQQLADELGETITMMGREIADLKMKVLAAERAREEAGGLLRDAWGFTTCDEGLFHRIAAFLAANGGRDE